MLSISPETDDKITGVPQFEVTPEMIEAVAEVILIRCGNDRATMSWAIPIAEDCLEAAVAGVGPLRSSGVKT